MSIHQKQGQKEKCKEKTLKARTTRKAIPWTALAALAVKNKLMKKQESFGEIFVCFVRITYNKVINYELL